MHLESAAPSGKSVALFNELREQKLNKQLQLLFAKTLLLELRNETSLSCKAGIDFVEINEN